MTALSVRVEQDDRGVAWLTLARPAVKNAFDAQLIAELTEAASGIEKRAPRWQG